MGKLEISKENYEGLLLNHQKVGWAGFQSSEKTNLGVEKTFQVKDSNIKVKCVCVQHGGTWSGYYTYRAVF